MAPNAPAPRVRTARRQRRRSAARASAEGPGQGSSRTSRELAAVDAERGAGDERCPIRAQPGDCRRNLPDGAQAGEGHAGGDPLARRRIQGRETVGGDRTRRDRVEADSVPAVVERRGPEETRAAVRADVMDAKLRGGGVLRNTPERESPVAPRGDAGSLLRRTRRASRSRYARPNVRVTTPSAVTTGSIPGTRWAVSRDAVVAAAALGLTLATLAHGSGATRTLDALGVALSAMACLPLLARSRWPLEVFLVCTVASAAIESLGYALGLPFGPTVALFYLAADRRTPDRMRQTAATVVALGAIHVGVAAATTLGISDGRDPRRAHRLGWRLDRRGSAAPAPTTAR